MGGFVIQEALKDLLGGTLKEMMEAEMSRHLGYATRITLATGTSQNASIIPKRQKDISDTIEEL